MPSAKIGFVRRLGARFAWLVRHRKGFGAATSSELPRLLVDVSAIMNHDAQTGVQRVVRAVWSELRRRDGEGFRLVPVFATHGHGYCYAPIEIFDCPTARGSQEPVKACAGDKFLGLDLSAHYLPKYRQQLRAWRRYGATVHIVVYDLLPLLRPEWFNKATSAHFRKWFDVVANEADQAICISKQVSRDLRDRLHAMGRETSLPIVHMQMGGDIAASRPSVGLSPEVSRLLDRLRFRPAILMVGTIEPRKGYDTALAAFEHLWRTRGGDAPDLVIVGKGGWKTSAIQSYIRSHPEHGVRLHWLDQVSDEGLCKLYEASRGLLMASRGEGFGLPLIEAVSQRQHVLARDLPVFREQNLPNVEFFEDDDPASLGKLLMDLSARGVQRPTVGPSTPGWSESVGSLLRSMGITHDTPVDRATVVGTAS